MTKLTLTKYDLHPVGIPRLCDINQIEINGVAIHMAGL